ncbi:DUF2213 domain-containing protein, partial [Bradyrhizobium sp.]|uniref:DUF2213 domain-containing protein n=1 Tax=Bradyrhizobium sp. TaxID=376 RepID=UPI003C3F5014
MAVSTTAANSVRSKDFDRRLHVESSAITKANICPYKGGEIPNWQALGLDPLKTYRLLRDPRELDKAASTFNSIPILIRHVPVSAKAPRQDLVVGTTGSQARFEAPYLKNSLALWTQEAIDLVERDIKRELSSAYRYVALMTPGIYEGLPYDGVMTQIAGNHVALVIEGRAGPDVLVADELPRSLRKMSETAVSAAVAKAIAPFLKSVSAEDKRAIAMALDSALGEMPTSTGHISLDEDLDDEEKKKAEDEYCADKKMARDEMS